MFRLFKKPHNESGIVLFIVLMTAIIIMIIAASILSQSANEINFAQQQIDEIAADQLAQGVFWNEYSSGGMQDIAISTNLQGRVYQTALSSSAIASPPSNAVSVVANYDSLQ